MRTFVLLLTLLTTVSMFSQKEANNWFFGENVGLDFNSNGKPSTQTGKLNTLEGCASISDENGNLIFYSDGSTVWSRNHREMPNGTDLLGDISSSQSAIIVPNPKKPNIYYLFTVGSTVIPSGYHYYTIDMNLNNGFGDVTGEAVDLSDGKGEFWSEKITAVETDTCDEYWVISVVDDIFYSYKVDENGVSKTPVLSLVDFVSRSSRGYLKVSPNGKKIAVAHQGISQAFSRLILYDYDKATGSIIGEGIELFGPGNNNGVDAPYGVEFSPKSTKLYASMTDMATSYKLYQYDLESADIPLSMTLIHEEEAFRGALQLGPDRKIYATIPEEYEVGTHFLDVIHNPEAKGLACNFEQDYINFGSGYTMQGLPPFIQSLFIEDDINIVNPYEAISETSSQLNICYDSSYTLQGDAIPGAEYFWTFDDGTGEVDLPTPSPPHELTVNAVESNTSGTYRLSIDTNDSCDTQLFGLAEVSFSDPPNINPQASLNKCDLFDSNANDGLSFFNLEESIEELTYNKASDFLVYFYLTDTEAETDSFNQNSLQSYFTNTAPNQEITAKIFPLNSQCYRLAKVQLTANISINLPAEDMTSCDLGDGTGLFDFDEKSSQIIQDLALPNTLEIKYYERLEDAINNENALESTLSTSSGQIHFFAENNGICYGSGSFMVNVQMLPDIEQEETIILCDSTYPLTLDASIPQEVIDQYEFLWNTGETTFEIDILEEQVLTVLITNKAYGCDLLKTYTVVNAGLPVITDIAINPNENTVNVATQENLDNLYALNDPLGDYQSDPLFTGIGPGIYDVFVKNKYECGLSTQKIYVLGFPKFFTPNNDGVNDSWEIKGADLENFTFSDIHIFNRFGKHITSIPVSTSWNGFYNGEFLPSSDYWFSVNITDNESVTKNYKGHFSLIRR